MQRKLIFILIVVLFVLQMASASAQGRTLTFIEIIIDCSDSMKRDVDGVKKLDAAKSALIDFINKAPESYRFALRIMGGDASATYYQSKLVAEIGFLSKFSLIEEIQKLEPVGERSLYNALLECTYDYIDDSGNNIALVITDGLDEGEQSIADLADTYKSTPGAPKVYLFGLDITPSMKREFNLFVQSSGGAVYSIANPAQLKDRISQALSGIGANLSVFLYDDKGVPVSGDIIIRDQNGNPIYASYESESLAQDLPDGVYDIEAKHKGETKRKKSVEIRAGKSETIKFVFFQRAGSIRVILIDSLLNPLKGYLEVRDLNYTTLYEGGPESTFFIALPEGTYEFEATAGGRSHIQGGIMISEGRIQDIEMIIPLMQAVLEVEVNNTQSYPINAHIRVYSTDGFLLGEAQYTSYYQITLPPDTYNVSVEAGNDRQEQTISLYDGDQQTLSFDVQVEVGFLHIDLRTESGRDAWGVVRVYDERGQYQRHWSIEADESPDWNLELPEGIYRIEAEVDGIVSTRDGVVVGANIETRITITFPESVF